MHPSSKKSICVLCMSLPRVDADVSHLSPDVFMNVYEPAEDSFLFVDALSLKQSRFLKELKPQIVVEIGVGSGYVLACVAKCIAPSSIYYLGTDINAHSTAAAYATLSRNGIHNFDIVTTSFLEALNPRLHGKVDVLLFNPPYVPSPDSEVGSCGIEAAWAGGLHGRVVIDRLLPHVSSILSPCGVFYLLLLDQNKPEEIAAIMSTHGFVSDCVMKRRAGMESLLIARFRRKK